jgi:hypothetical protein
MLGPTAAMVPTIGKTGQAFIFRWLGNTPARRTKKRTHWLADFANGFAASAAGV